MNLRKIVGRAALSALVLSVLPYQIKKDKETGSVEVRSLLWGWKKIPGEEKNHISFAIPGSGLNDDAPKKDEEPAEESAAETPAEAPSSDAPAADPAAE